MTDNKPASSEEIIEQVIALMFKKVPASQQAILEQFIRQYYNNTAAEDLAESKVANLYGAALSHWNFARTRSKGDSKVRIYNPQFEEHGWQSTHTVVEIVNDDMPFLVDSVRMKLNARNLTTHLVIHPVINIRRDSRGHITEILNQSDKHDNVGYEAVIHVEVDRQTEKSVLKSIAQDLQEVLQEATVAVEDWKPMCAQLHQIIDELKASQGSFDQNCEA